MCCPFCRSQLTEGGARSEGAEEVAADHAEEQEVNEELEEEVAVSSDGARQTLAFLAGAGLGIPAAPPLAPARSPEDAEEAAADRAEELEVDEVGPFLHASAQPTAGGG